MNFDINKHEWSDRDIEEAHSGPYGRIVIHLNCFDLSYINIENEDAIAIAKHFGLTAGDIAQPPQSKE